MMIDWNEYHKQIGATLGELMKLSPDTVRGYQTLSAANSKTGKLDEKTRQLISLAVAVTTHCDGCIVVHSEAALKAGATKEEIAEALGVAVAMKCRSRADLFHARARRCQREERSGENGVILFCGSAACCATTGAF
jgi:AhpD family alkylhydroperoxidase